MWLSGEIRFSSPAINPSADSRPGAAKKSILVISVKRLRKREIAAPTWVRAVSLTLRTRGGRASSPKLRMSAARLQ